MTGNRGWVGEGMLFKLLIGLVVLLVPVMPARGSEGLGGKSPETLAGLQAAGVSVFLDRQLGTARFLGAGRRAPLVVPGTSPGAAPAFNALVLADRYGALFGLTRPREELLVKKTGDNGTGGGMVRYQQLRSGVPVLGGELVVNMDRSGAMLSMNGEIGAVPQGLSLTPAVESTRAAATALAAVAKWRGMGVGELEAGVPVLSIYDPRLLGPGRGGQVRLVWRLEVRPLQLAPIRELVLVDAETGGIVLRFNQVDTVMNRRTYTANSTNDLEHELLCTEAAGDVCTGGENINTEANFAHLYVGATYDFYLTNHGRDSYDDQGATLVSTVEFADGSTCPNAFWDGNQMVFCQGLPGADDVVAHELTHAVTDATSQLFYYYQSGAINEALSDLWGEFVDLAEISGNDDSTVRWLIGEEIDSPDTVPAMVGALRDMKDPTLAVRSAALSDLAHPQPDKMSSDLYYLGSEDNGGVHINSGINNKAVYLLTDGGSFNGRTVTGLGIAKVAKIYYEAQTNLLTSGADYLDLHNVLAQACDNLVGTDGITAADCDQVRTATAAVEMNLEPAANFNPEAEICAEGVAVEDLFFDNLENGSDKWSLSSTSPESWRYEKGYATSGSHMFWGEDVDIPSDHRVESAGSVTLPPGQSYLHFRHAFDFEYDPEGPIYYDGGVLEYATDADPAWKDAMVLYDSGKNYHNAGFIFSGYGNPLAGRRGFVGISHGYVSTRLNLASLAGQKIKFRWRLGTDESIGALGWVLDDVRVYACGNTAPTAKAGLQQSVARQAAVTLNGATSSDSDGAISAYAWSQTGGTAVTLNNANTATPNFMAPISLGTLTFSLTVTDNLGAIDTDTVSVTVVNTAPAAEAGPNRMVNFGAAVTLNGGASADGDGTIVSYVWAQTLGPTVTMNDADTATPSFTALSMASTSAFRLTVTDNDGATASDTVTVTVTAPPAAAPADSGGGGGCSLSADGGVDPTLLLIFLAVLVMVWRRRNRAS